MQENIYETFRSEPSFVGTMVIVFGKVSLLSVSIRDNAFYIAFRFYTKAKLEIRNIDNFISALCAMKSCQVNICHVAPVVLEHSAACMFVYIGSEKDKHFCLVLFLNWREFKDKKFACNVVGII